MHPYHYPNDPFSSINFNTCNKSLHDDELHNLFWLSFVHSERVSDDWSSSSSLFFDYSERKFMLWKDENEKWRRNALILKKILNWWYTSCSKVNLILYLFRARINHWCLKIKIKWKVKINARFSNNYWTLIKQKSFKKEIHASECQKCNWVIYLGFIYLWRPWFRRSGDQKGPFLN